MKARLMIEKLRLFDACDSIIKSNQIHVASTHFRTIDMGAGTGMLTFYQ
jgi:hypothetical protein